ncbi:MULTISPECIES: DUF600 domain-containing protein [Paenibacillus]|uniref:DUF600 domain-containing protein n=1 Tax=Paenibacillus TaxID=44249 RepID=UPI001F397F16|nr:DUF600 domain-containing protein [Paenibacillus sp. JJ-223]CAH1225087.1 hypothetical protein PAECIP111890_05745 [Paenibacillus sp. JJ-223]
MTKSFEDYFSELQADMVSTCLEYVDRKADDIYLYCSYEPEAYYFNVFYRINKTFVLKHKINDAVKVVNGTPEYNYDVSRDRQLGLLDIGTEDLKKIHEVCKAFRREMPTEMKLHYNVEKNSLAANFKYDLVYSNDDELLPDDIFEQWFEEIKSQG